MKKRSLWACHLVLLIALLCALLAPVSTNAQSSTLPPTPVPHPTGTTPLSGEAVIVKGDDSRPFDEQLKAIRVPTDDEPDEAATMSEEAAAPVAVAPVAVAPAASPNAATLLVDVSVPDEIRANSDLLYTYAYTNTGTTTADTVIIEAIWTRFNVAANRDWQSCNSSLCDVVPGSVEGPAVTRVAPASGDRARYKLSGLGAGQSGHFSVLLKTKADIYPKTNQAPTRPAGSAQIYLDNATTPSDDDTAATLVAGPVLTLAKAAADRNLKIYPTETAEFVITVGNATGTGDKVGGVIRADARPATNVVIRDTFPAGSEFVSATGNPVVNANAKTVTWTIAGPFNPDSKQEFRVTFRKLDVNTDCTRLSNSTYNVTSDEYPLNGATRYDVDGSGVAVPVIAPVAIKSVVASPSSVVYGTGATIAIVVQNFWNQPLTGAQLNYDIQTNAFYQAGSATPTPSATPNSAITGGRLSWTFNMPAGSKTTPSEATFTLSVLGTYTNNAQAGTAQVIAPADVPSACIVSRSGRVNLTPRLEVTKAAELDPDVIVDNAFPVQRNQDVAYTITIENTGNADATAVDVTDAIPGASGANFSYVPNSATLNGQAHEPDSISNGRGGSLIWTQLIVPAGGKIVLRYMLNVDGFDYVRYCNNVTAESGDENIIYPRRQVCVKINPQIEIIKTADRTTTTAGGEVQFTLRLTNREPQAYRVGMYDLLGEFTFVRQISGYAEPEVIANGDALQWPLVDLARGGILEVTIVATVPNNCQTREYLNEGMFYNPTGLVRMIPRALARVKVTCGVIEFSKARDRDIVSLGDRVVYTLNVRNADAAAASNIQVDDILPQGFRYEAMDPSSDIKTSPTQTAQDGTTKLTWTIGTLASTKTSRIKFIARSGNVVGDHINRMIVPTGGKCTGSCVTGSDGLIYSAVVVKVQPLITVEPSIDTTACAKPGDKRVYTLKILNTNNHDYNNITVTIALPLGLNYVGSQLSGPAPTVTTNDSGSTLTWSGLRVLAKPGNVFASQLTLTAELEVGQVLGSLDTLVTTSSSDGTIPRKDGVADPTIPVCVTDPTIAIDAYPRLVQLDGEVLYQISLVNTTTDPIQASVADTLPTAMSYLRSIEGPSASVNGQTLTWANVTIPATANGRPGIVRIKFRAQLVDGVAGRSYTNGAQVTASSVPFDTTYSSVVVTAADEVFSVALPLVRR